MTKFKEYTIWIGSPEAPQFRLSRIVTRENMESTRYCSDLLGEFVKSAIREFDDGAERLERKGTE